MTEQTNVLSKHQKIELSDNFELLDLMMKDSHNQPPLYKPGPYWASKTKNAANEIKKYGIREFRGSKNNIGVSYADNLYIDYRNSLNYNWRTRLVQWMTKQYPLGMIFDAQVKWTESYAKQSLIYAQEILNLKERTGNLLKKYSIPYSLLGNSLAKAKIAGQDLSIHYLNLLEQHDNIASRIRFNDAKSVFEIGGGFGVNIHLLLQNYVNIRKVLYLDIPPNLYVGTQYLRAFYDKAVFDYAALKHLDSIKFSPNNDIEIFCITPWQIEKFESAVDIFMNAHSFVEMPLSVVKNYINKIAGFPESRDRKSVV